MRLKPVYPLPVLVLSLLLPCLAAAAGNDAEAWLQADDPDKARLVNEGGLVFLRDAPDHRVLHTRNRLTITPASLHNGWVRLYQCQSNLDPVPEVEVMYRYRGLRNLRVISSIGMKGAWVKNNSVQMEQVEEWGEVCIKAEVQILESDGAGGYTLQSGPFHRRFLDGYYPVFLDYRIRWPAGLLQLESVDPAVQEGFRVRARHGELAVDTLFEGQLTINSAWRARRRE